MPNGFAYIALFGWPLVVIILFRTLPRAQAVAWSVIGGYLALPYGVGVDPPILPNMDKDFIPSVSAALLAIMIGKNQAEPVHERRPRDAVASRAATRTELSAQPEDQNRRSGFTRQEKRRPPRTSAAPEPTAAGQGMLRVPRILTILIVLLILNQFLTVQQNADPYVITGRVLPGLRPYDAFSMILDVTVMLLPFYLGQRYLAAPDQQAILLRVLCVAGLVYSLPTLLEIRISPQLARWTYGFLAQSFLQAMRDGGYRPVVFLQHGLWLAIFLAISAMAAFSLWWNDRMEGRSSLAWLAGLWLTGVLFLCHSLGAMFLLIVLIPILLLRSIRLQMFVATLIAATMLIYPTLRGSGAIPVQAIYQQIASFSDERAQSLKFRFDNEDQLLAHANGHALAGWGGYGRARVYDPETGQDISVTDGTWIILMGSSGWIGYLVTYGLLTAPVIILFLRQRRLGITPSTAGLCIILSANLIDMIANATLTPLTWLVAGALAGRCRVLAKVPDAKSETNSALVSRPPDRSRKTPSSGPARTLRRQPIRTLLLIAMLATSVSGSTAATILAGIGVPDPSLAFGLTAVSDWSTEMPFLDLMKYSRPFIGHSASNWNAMGNDALDSGGYLDANGWPTSIPPGLSSVGTIWAWDSSDTTAAASRAGIYVLSYTGEGTLKVSGDVKVLSTAPGQIVVQNLSGGTMEVDITSTDPNHNGNYIRDISMVPQQYQALAAAGEIFNPDWLALVQDARELRFMDWMDTNNTTSAHWSDRPQVGDASWAGKGVPVEVMVALANQTGTEPWFNMPAGADASYIQNFATYVRDHLNPALKVHVEYSNETWNFAFGQTQWLAAQAKSVWGSTDGSAWLSYDAMLATKSALIWDQVFGAQAHTRVDNVLGTQTANLGIANQLLTASLWKQYDPTGYVAPSSVFDSLAVTTYFGTSTMSDTTLRNELLTVLKTPGTDATAWLKAKMEDPTYSQSIPQIVAEWASNKAIADKYGLDLVAYEGGQHLLQSAFLGGISASDLATLTNFLSGFVRSQAMADLYHELWVDWAQVSNGPFMQFNDVQAVDKFGAWGLFSALGDHSPRANLLMDLNLHTSAWFGSGGGVQYQQGVITVGTGAADTLTGTNKDDFLIANNGRDTIIAGMGHDAIAGGSGFDTLVLAGSAKDYTLVAEGDGYRLTGPGTNDFIRSIQQFAFDDSTKTLDEMSGK